jgi:hypothetical protein
MREDKTNEHVAGIGKKKIRKEPWSESLKGGDNSEDLVVGRMTILKWSQGG